MTNKEMLKLMSGTKENKKTLFDYLIDKVQNSIPLDDSEVPVLEFLKKELIKEPSTTVSMSASLAGKSEVLK